MHLINRPFTVYFISGLISLILSFYISSHVDLINPDAICYLQSAETMPQGLHAAMNLCGQAKWPFYSLLIFLMAKTTHLNLTDSAYLLNAIFSLIAVLSFIRIIQCISPIRSQLLLWLGAFVILLAHEFNALKQDVIRDHGFFAFYLLSILFLIDYFRTKTWRSSLGWSVSLIIATLFRIEGAVFLLLLPFLSLIDSQSNFIGRIKSFVRLSNITLFVTMVLAIWLFYHPSHHLSRLYDLQYQLVQGWKEVLSNFATRTDLLATHVLTLDSAHDASLVFFLTLLSWYTAQLIITLSLIYTALVIYAWWKNSFKMDCSSRYVLWGYIFINLLITFTFLIERFFLSKRYLVAMTLVLMMWVPFGLKDLLNQWQLKKKFVSVAFALILISGVGGITHFGYSKSYLHQAGNWLAQNAPLEAKIYSNDYQVMYYSKHFGNTIFEKQQEFSDLNRIRENRWTQFDYLALSIKKKERKENCWVYSEISPVPVKTFTNNRGDEVLIYKVLNKI